MGRGNGKTEVIIAADDGPAMRSSAMRTASEPAVSIPWDKPGGAEATDKELEQYIWSHHIPEGRVGELIQQRDEQNHTPDSFHGNMVYLQRRTLEAALAFEQGISLAEFKEANADVPWLELMDELQSDGVTPTLWRAAIRAESEIRMAEARKVSNLRPQASVTPFDADAANLELVRGADHPTIRNLGTGARTGNIEDYDRVELRKLLGFLERECHDLSDDDLRGMALGGGLIPQWKTSPSHAQLAMMIAKDELQGREIFADVTSRDGKRGLKKFQECMRAPYANLAKHYASKGINDEGDRPYPELIEDLARTNQFMLMKKLSKHSIPRSAVN